jgi:radical SAM superfamily enzyme YgiQ (UPF0313 family)
LKKKTLILINPANKHRKGFLLRNESRQVPLALGILAALTPSEWKVIILDENFKSFRYRDADLVGITSFTSTVSRAYEIAALYREKGIPVVLGGIHVSALPDEALHYADAVVIGEAEESWPKLLEDFENSALKKKYESGFVDLDSIPVPRHDLFHPGYFFASIQTSRGCPHQCDFCSVPSFNGHKYRMRKIGKVLEEIRQVKNKLLYFVDDNIIGYGSQAEAHAVELFEGMIQMNLKTEWFAQASLDIAQKPHLLKLAAKAGCRMLLIGIEAESEAALTDSNKKLNLKIGTSQYAKAFREIHKHGIAVLGAFIYGMDSDTPEALRARTKYILNSSVDVVQASVMTPLPGTRLFNRLKEEDRLLATNTPQAWEYFHFSDVVFKPLHMNPGELAGEMDWAYSKLLNKNTLRKKFLRTLWNTRSIRTALWVWNSNLNYRSVAFEKATTFQYTDRHG